jgi:hypothetical protein
MPPVPFPNPEGLLVPKPVDVPVPEVLPPERPVVSPEVDRSVEEPLRNPGEVPPVGRVVPAPVPMEVEGVVTEEPFKESLPVPVVIPEVPSVGVDVVPIVGVFVPSELPDDEPEFPTSVEPEPMPGLGFPKP